MFKKIAVLALLTLLTISIVSCTRGIVDAATVNNNPVVTTVKNDKYNVNVAEFLSNLENGKYNFQDTVRISGTLVKKEFLDTSSGVAYKLTLNSGGKDLAFQSQKGSLKESSMFDDIRPLIEGNQVTLELKLIDLNQIELYLGTAELPKYLREFVVVK